MNLLAHRKDVRKLTVQMGLTLVTKYLHPSALSNDQTPIVLSFNSPCHHMAFWHFAPIITA